MLYQLIIKKRKYLREAIKKKKQITYGFLP